MAIYTVGATTRYLPNSGRIKVTLGGNSKIVGYDYSCSGSAHRQAVADSWDHWDIEGTVVSCDYVADSESGKGSVYLITYERGE